MKPYKTVPVLIERIWGGTRLSDYNKSVGRTAIGESWETGPLNGDVPVLIKLIDARDTLSVQVHPDDDFSAKAENAPNGKSEAWIVLECEEDSFIIYGFNRGIKKGDIRSLSEGDLLHRALNYVKVKKGDCIFVPAGTVHSIGKGVLIYEVQQPSDLTYRIYDWNRADQHGEKRELHIDKAEEAINYFSGSPVISNVYDLSKEAALSIIQCKYFEAGFGFLAEKEKHYPKTGRFNAVTVVSGCTMLKFEDMQLLIKKGDTCIIPEEYDRITCIEGLEASEYIIVSWDNRNML